MANNLPLTSDGAELGRFISDVSGKGIYASAQLIVALARLAGPRAVLGKDAIDTSNPTSDDEGAASIGRSTPRLSQVTLSFQKPIQRSPLLTGRKSSKSSSSGATTPKPPEEIKLPVLKAAFSENTRSSFDLSTTQSEVLQASYRITPLFPEARRPSSQMRRASPPPSRRPILRVKQSSVSSTTSGDTSTADSRSRTSAWHPQLIPEDTTEMVDAEHANADSRSNLPMATSPTRTVSFGMSDEQAQYQVKTFRSQTKYRVRGAKPKFSQENLSTNAIAITDEEEDLSPSQAVGYRAHAENAIEMQDPPSTPKREQRTQTRIITPQRMTSPTQMRYTRPSSGGGVSPMSPIAFLGTPPRTPRNHSGVLSLAGSRRTSFASSNGDSSSNRYSRQTVEVVVNEQRSANYVSGMTVLSSFALKLSYFPIATGQLHWKGTIRGRVSRPKLGRRAVCGNQADRHQRNKRGRSRSNDAGSGSVTTLESSRYRAVPRYGEKRGEPRHRSRVSETIWHFRYKLICLTQVYRRGIISPFCKILRSPERGSRRKLCWQNTGGTQLSSWPGCE